MDKHELFGFTNVDQTADPEYFIRFLDEASAQDSVLAYKRATYALLDVREGQHVLDVGCGTGEDAQALARLVGAAGQVVGVDGSQIMIAEANKRAEKLGLPLPFLLADAHRLDFPDNTFDACRCDRSFMHLENPGQALREMVRVTRPGGLVLVYEVDFETVTVDVRDRKLARKVVNFWCDGFRNGWLGRHVPALFREVGLLDINVVPATLRVPYSLASQMIGPPVVERARAAGLLSADEATAWLEELREAEEEGRFFCTLTGFIVVGRKPGV
jgi:ubiquinone/menaquinone biosynthesis C-methylase UbiE